MRFNRSILQCVPLQAQTSVQQMRMALAGVRCIITAMHFIFNSLNFTAVSLNCAACADQQDTSRDPVTCTTLLHVHAIRAFRDPHRCNYPRPPTFNICETGFNAGHSASAFLLSSPESVYYAWDLGIVPASHTIAALLQEKYPGRV